MTKYIWRYSHLALAVFSFILLTLASGTGIILSFEPVADQSKSYRVDGFNQITLSQTLPALRKSFTEITELTVNPNQSVQVKGIDDLGKSTTVFVNPKTGEILGKPIPKSEFFNWVTNLHRSLFLKETGRLLVGITSFLLILSVVSGAFLIIRRQLGVKRFFTKVVKDNFAQYYHVYLGRLMIIPILIVAITGTYLSMERFGVIEKSKTQLKVDFDAIKSSPEKKTEDIDLFKNSYLSDVKSIEFPFSDDVEDYFTIKFADREVALNQVTGDILAEVKYPKSVVYTDLSLDLHTGRSNIVWAIFLGVVSANILFFIYSGFVITYKRISKQVKNKFKAKDAELIILVGTENGSTFNYAQQVYKSLLKLNCMPFVSTLNEYTQYPKAKHLIILTATYGEGEAPAKASKFLKLVDEIEQQQYISYSVVGFGSKTYADFCKYAYEVDAVLRNKKWANAITDVSTVNDKSPSDFILWTELWAKQSDISLQISPKDLETKKADLVKFLVTDNRAFENQDVFTVHLIPKRNVKIQSGDLLAIYPANDYRERLYSIGIVENQIHLSIRLYENGLGSSFLKNLNPNNEIEAKIVKNEHFHFPKKASMVIMISNGTGIAPFLGFIDENKANKAYHLYSGFRNHHSLEPYKALLENAKSNGKLSNYKVAYSREHNGHYVNELVIKDADFFAETLKNNGVIMICGSLAMEKDVMLKLEEICRLKLDKSISEYQSKGQILRDCY
jgi:sulfite reductase (NADPH) flavoprotein alpha-component